MKSPGEQRIDLDALADAVNEALAEQPLEAEPADAEQLAALMERAKKLLVMAERGTTQGERDAFADKAAALMARYGISSAMLVEDGKVSSEISDWTAEVSGPLCYDKVSLLAAMVDAYGGKLIYVEKNPQHSTLRVYATTADMERIHTLWPSLLRQMTTELGGATANKPYGVRADVFGRSFIHGFVSVVLKRLRDAEAYAARQAQEQRGGGTSVALVLAGKGRKVEDAFRKAHPRITKGRRKLTSSQAGVTAGQRAGERADLGQAKVGA
jgi:hypothetical protein